MIEPYFRPNNLGPDCSTERSTRLRERRFAMGYEARAEPEEYTRLAAEAREIYLQHEDAGPAMARARELRHVVENCPIIPEPDALFLGGEDPFFFNLMLPTLQADKHSRHRDEAPDEASAKLRAAVVFLGACFEGHITPGLEYILGQGVSGLQARVEEQIQDGAGRIDEDFFEALRWSCESMRLYAQRLGVVMEGPAETLVEALQSYWIVYCLVTLEMGGCCPGGGLGLGRLDQFLHPYYKRDIEAGRLTREQALELLELFLLQFRHCDYYTGHQVYTPGSQSSLGGQTPLGEDAFNELTELLMEASLRLQMPAPYLSVRLHKNASERAWRAYANYVAGGLGFAVVNDEVLIPSFLRHGRSLTDARDYICSCCYENTIPGREAFNPNGSYLNLPFVLELALNEGRSLLTGEQLGVATPPLEEMSHFADVLAALRAQLHHVAEALVGLVNAVDERHVQYRRYPLMSLLMDDCLARGKDVCAGGARYNLTGCIVSGLPNVVNSLAALREVFAGAGSPAIASDRTASPTPRADVAELHEALRTDFDGNDDLRRRLAMLPKWGNGDGRVDDLAAFVTEALYASFRHRVNARGGRWQLALYSFVANHFLGEVVGASADGRPARASLTRNLNPTWGTDRHGPTAVLQSLSHIDFTKFPDGTALDLRFDPALFATPEGRSMFVGFLKAFVDLGVMQMQISMVDTQTLLDAREHPAQYPNLMVKVAGYSARFVDLSPQEMDEIIGRTVQRI